MVDVTFDAALPFPSKSVTCKLLHVLGFMLCGPSPAPRQRAASPCSYDHSSHEGQVGEEKRKSFTARQAELADNQFAPLLNELAAVALLDANDLGPGLLHRNRRRALMGRTARKTTPKIPAFDD